MRNLWPNDLRENKIKSPSTIISQQASYLGSMTNNVVLAEAELLSDSYKNSFAVAFDLIAPALNNYRYRLFKIYHDLSFYPLIIELSSNFGEEVKAKEKENNTITCESEDEFITVLERIFTSNHTKTLIQSLIAQSQAFVQGVHEDDIPF